MENLPSDPSFAHASPHSLPASAESPPLKPTRRLKWFIWGLVPSLALLLLYLPPVFDAGSNFFGGDSMLGIVLLGIPSSLLEVGVCLTVGKATRWFGIGLLVGFVLYMVLDIAFWYWLLSEI